MGFVSLILMIVGWLLIIFNAFGSGLTLHVGNLSGFDVGVLFVLAALCIGGASVAFTTITHRT